MCQKLQFFVWIIAWFILENFMPRSCYIAPLLISIRIFSFFAVVAATLNRPQSRWKSHAFFYLGIRVGRKIISFHGSETKWFVGTEVGGYYCKKLVGLNSKKWDRRIPNELENSAHVAQIKLTGPSEVSSFSVLLSKFVTINTNTMGLVRMVTDWCDRVG